MGSPNGSWERPVPSSGFEVVAGTSASKPTSILIVEDEEAVAELIESVLVRHGYRLLTAATPQIALSLAHAESRPIDLLISDVVLPQMSGSALAERILHMHPDMRVLYMSGYTYDTIVRRGVLDHRTPFLQKPFSLTALAQKVREVLTRSTADVMTQNKE